MQDLSVSRVRRAAGVPRGWRVAGALVALVLALGMAARSTTARADDPPTHFQPAVVYPVGGYTYSVATGPFFACCGGYHTALNLVSVDYGDHVNLQGGNGDGTFAPPTAIPTKGFGATHVVMADLNGDGNTDIVTANSYSNNVSVLLGNGDGTFKPAVTYPTGGNYPGGIVVGDFNGDGKLDIAVTHWLSNNVSVLLGNGDGTFQAPITSPAIANLWTVVAGDFNGDGKLDLAAVPYYGNTLSIMLGNGNGTFQAPINYTVGSGTAGVATGDFNGDGKLDLATADYYSNNVDVLLGNGDGSFQAPVSYAAGNGANAIAAADLNGDGHADLVIGDYNNGTVSVLQGVGDGTFGAPLTFGAGGYPIGNVITGDFNSDGQTDVAAVADFTSASEGNVSVLMNDTFPTTTPVYGNILAGNLTEHLYYAPSFAGTLDGRDEVLSYQIPLEVNDARGAGLGWNLTITSTQFRTGVHTLATNASDMTGVNAACVYGATCTGPTNIVGYPLVVPAGAVAPPPVKWFDAQPGTGMGAMDVTPTITVRVPANAYAGTYVSTLTLAVISGP